MSELMDLRDTEQCEGDCKTCGADCLEAGIDPGDYEEYIKSFLDRKYFRVAISMENSAVANDLSMESTLKVYDLNEKRTVEQEDILFPMENNVMASGIADFLKKEGVSVVISGKISPAVQKQLELLGIEAHQGARGSVPFVMNQYLKGKLN